MKDNIWNEIPTIANISFRVNKLLGSTSYRHKIKSVIINKVYPTIPKISK